MFNFFKALLYIRHICHFR
ncbi:hypothetical protein D030_4759A, partial [Vibrio parahaemolyticus AQ3810]